MVALMSSSEVILDTETVKVVMADTSAPVSTETQTEAGTEVTYQTEVINQLQVTNALLGDILGALIFIIIALVMIILYRLIHYNVTNNI